jgi:hypothetical protein
MTDLFEWWAGLSPWVRFGVAILFLLAAAVRWVTGTFSPWLWGIGIVLLLFAFPSKTERKGYHDF